MKRTKLTIRLDPKILAIVNARALNQHRGLSNMVESLLCTALRRRRPAPDRPMTYDERYTRHSRKPPK